MMTLDLALRAAALLGLGLVAARALHAASAATRHALWRLILLAVLALPALTPVSPRWVVLGWNQRQDTAWFLQPQSEASPLAPSSAPTSPIATSTPPLDGAPWPPARSVAAVWASGVFVVALFYLLGHARLWILCRHSTPAPLAWTSSALRLSRRLGLRAVPEVSVSQSVPGPLVAGLFRSIVLLPSDAAGWPEARREAVLVHELAHIRRRDVQAQLLAHVVCAFHWFNPLAWLASRQMRRERELACDDAVLGAGMPPAWYATELLAMAREATGRHAPAAALSMARPSEMEGRLLAMLADRPRRMSLVARGVLPLLVGCAGLAAAGASPSAPPMASNLETARATATTRRAWIITPPTGEDARSAGESAREATASLDASTRERATLALAFTAGDEVVPALLKALEDADSQVREKAAIGLAWRRDPRIVPALLEAATDADAQVREKVVVALAFSSDPRADAVLERARTDPDPQVREKALKLSALR